MGPTKKLPKPKAKPPKQKRFFLINYNEEKRIQEICNLLKRKRSIKIPNKKIYSLRFSRHSAVKSKLKGDIIWDYNQELLSIFLRKIFPEDHLHEARKWAVDKMKNILWRPKDMSTTQKNKFIEDAVREFDRHERARPIFTHILYEKFPTDDALKYLFLESGLRMDQLLELEDFSLRLAGLIFSDDLQFIPKFVISVVLELLKKNPEMGAVFYWDDRKKIFNYMGCESLSAEHMSFLLENFHFIEECGGPKMERREIEERINLSDDEMKNQINAIWRRQIIFAFPSEDKHKDLEKAADLILKRKDCKNFLVLVLDHETCMSLWLSLLRRKVFLNLPKKWSHLKTKSKTLELFRNKLSKKILKSFKEAQTEKAFLHKCIEVFFNYAEREKYLNKKLDEMSCDARKFAIDLSLNIFQKKWNNPLTYKEKLEIFNTAYDNVHFTSDKVRQFCDLIRNLHDFELEKLVDNPKLFDGMNKDDFDKNIEGKIQTIYGCLLTKEDQSIENTIILWMNRITDSRYKKNCPFRIFYSALASSKPKQINMYGIDTKFLEFIGIPLTSP